MPDRGVNFRYYRALWKLKVPTKVKIFVWLLLQNKLMTQEVLITRGCNVDQGCVLCDNGAIETRDHMMQGCNYASRFWIDILAHFNLGRPHGDTIHKVWWNHRITLGLLSRVQWDMTWAAGTWTIWQERNRRIFTGATKMVPILINDAAIEIHNWMRCG